jgi:stage V sporulation protein B
MVTLSIFQLIVSTVFYMVAAQQLDKPDLGLVSTLTFLYTIFTTLAPLALPIAGTKYVSEFIGKNERDVAANVAHTVVRLVSLLSFIFLLGFSALSFAFISVFHWPQDVLIFLIITFVASSLAALRLTYMGLLQGLQLFDRYALSNVLALILARLVGLGLILFNFGLTGFAVGTLCGEVFGLLLSVFYYRGALPNAVAPYASMSLLKFSLPLFVMSIVTVSSEWIDRAIFLAVSHDLEALGVYELVIRGATSLTVIWAIIDVILLPVFSEAYGHKGKGELIKPLKSALRYLVFMYFPAALGLAAVSKTVMELLFGSGYVGGSLPLAILSVVSMLKAFTIIMGSTLKSMGETKVFVKASVTSLVVNGVIVAVLTPFLSLYGAVIGRVCAVLVVFLYIFYELKRNLMIEIDFQGLWKGTLASIVLVVPLQVFEIFIYGNLIESPVVSVALEILLGLIVYATTLFLLQALTREDFTLLKQLTPTSLLKLVEFFERLIIH